MPPQLSKSRFLAGLQCLKRLYFECYHRELADPVEANRQAIFNAGTAIGELARQRFPDGSLIEENYLEHFQAVRSTQTLLSDTAVPALYEAAFTFQGIRTRVDILKRNGQQEFDLVEVKSTTGVKPEHLPDVAIQMYAAEGSGIRIRRVYLMHINNGYVYQGGDHDLEQLFSLQDVTDSARSYVAENMPDDLARMWESLQRDDAPDIETSPHCKKPYQCPFYGHCHESEIKVNRQRFISPDLASSLEEIAFPATFLDFETVMPAIPVYAGTRPYQLIPFQWSLHIRNSSGQIRHDSFLNDDTEDPRERFITSLIEAIPREGAIVTYSHYEKTVMNGLAKAFPQYENRLLVLGERVIDLLKLIRRNYYHPEFNDSYSLKSVLPALVPNLSYADLAIPDGLAAATSYNRMIADDTPEYEKAEIREALLAYCQRDTEGMVHIYDALQAEAEGYG